MAEKNKENTVETGKTGESQGIEELTKKLLEKEKELEESIKLLQRTQADFQNYMKHSEKERHGLAESSCDDMIINTIEVYENMEAAVNSIPQTEECKKTLNGLNAVMRKMRKMLGDKGVLKIDSVGAKFDSSRHEAVESVERDDKPDHTIIEEIQSGYTIKNRLLRPAKVIVSIRKEVV
ncbi:MAG: nucleotide exchange factor GrpE [Candidatus Altiarchaeota archaeon]|nr:nucleotide exchange factor GrpE [Candidatus Altiarchaeota archaeon]